MEKERLIQIIENSYKSIDFINKYKSIMERYNDFEKRMRKVDKKEILNILKDLGYSFNVFSPGQDFYTEYIISTLKIVFSFKCKNAIMENYIYIYYNNEKIPFEENFTFIYRFLLGDMNMPATAPKFETYDEFKEIISSLLLIYEEFKGEFLKQVNEQNIA